METNSEILKLMERMEANSRRQSRLAFLQCIFSVIAAVCCIIILVAVLRFAPQIQALADQTQTLSEEALTIAQQAEDVLTDLQTVTDSLSQVDLAGMVTKVDDLVTESQTAVAQATEKLDAIDIEALNDAISDLSAVISPLADFFNIIPKF